jgi:hypothetical protein
LANIFNEKHGSIALKTPNGGIKMAPTTQQIQKKVVEFAKQKIGQKVGTGECFDLADKALTKAGGKTASDYGKVTLTANYVWGDPVATALAQPGDILQFKSYKLKIETTTKTKATYGKEFEFEYGGSNTETLTRPHHTAIVTKGGIKKVEILEQNVERSTPGVKEKKVGAATIPHTSESTTKTTSVQTTVDKAWGNKVKKFFDKKGWPQIDAVVKDFMSKKITEKTTVSVKTTVTGIIKAYRPKPK